MSFEPEVITEPQPVALQTGSIASLNDSFMMQVAQQHPRNLEKVVRSIDAQLELFPELAIEAYYAKPVGRGDDGSMNFARGLSIRIAETMGVEYQNSAFGVFPHESTDKEIFLLAGFFDYQNRIKVVVPAIISRYFTTRSGQQVRIKDDRFNNVVVPAKASIALRNAILRAMPGGLKAHVKAKAIEQAGGLLDATELNKITTYFHKLKVEQKHLERILGKPVQAWNEEDRINLLGVHNALKAGDVTVAQLIEESEEATVKARPRPNAKPEPGPTKERMDTPEPPAPPAPPIPEAPQGPKSTPVDRQAEAADEAEEARAYNARLRLEGCICPDNGDNRRQRHKKGCPWPKLSIDERIENTKRATADPQGHRSRTEEVTPEAPEPSPEPVTPPDSETPADKIYKAIKEVLKAPSLTDFQKIGTETLGQLDDYIEAGEIDPEAGESLRTTLVNIYDSWYTESCIHPSSSPRECSECFTQIDHPGLRSRFNNNRLVCQTKLGRQAGRKLDI